MEILNPQRATDVHNPAVRPPHSRLWKCSACQGVFGFPAPSPQPPSCGLCGNSTLQPVKS